MKKYCFPILLLCFVQCCFAQHKIHVKGHPRRTPVDQPSDGKKYYFSNSGSDSNDGLTINTPWKTLTKMETVCNNGTVVAGDRLLFHNNESFTGNVVIRNTGGDHAKNGRAKSPITISNYYRPGDIQTKKPIFQYPQGGSTAAEDRVLMWFYGLSYWIIDGINFTDLVNPFTDHVTPANCGVPVYLGVDGGPRCSNFSLRNCDVSYCGMGFVIIGDSCEVFNNTMRDFKNLKSTQHTNSQNQYEDYGANPLTIMGNDNEVYYNNVANGWAESYDFGYNGGFCEMFHGCKRNKIMWNTIIDCNGLSEFGNSGSAVVSSDNVFAYNLLINNGLLLYYNISGIFALQAYNSFFYNNVVIENDSSRFSGPRAGAGIVHSAALANFGADAYLFQYNTGPDSPNAFIAKNNIYKLSTGLKVKNGSSQLIHQNNIYQLSSPSTAGYTIGSSELNTTATIWQQTIDPDAANWDYNLTTGSPANRFGQPLAGFDTDFSGFTVDPDHPAAGILEGPAP